MLYAFFWMIPRRLKFICRRFGSLCSETSAYKFQTPGNHPKESIQHGVYCLPFLPCVVPCSKFSAECRAIVSTVFASHIHQCLLISVRAAVVSNAEILTFINMYATINKYTSAKENNYLITQGIKMSCKH